MDEDRSSNPLRLYWRSPEDLREEEEEEGSPRAGGAPLGLDGQPGESSRRDFLALAGFSLAAATLAACKRAPVEKAIPLLVGSDDITPGVANWYATTCRGCSASCGLLV